MSSQNTTENTSHQAPEWTQHTNSKSQNCDNCERSATIFSITCFSCKDISSEFKEYLSGQEKVIYCSIHCRLAHWSTHKHLCKRLQDQQTLYRAGSILQKLFFVYREKVFDIAISNIEVKDNSNLYYYKRDFLQDEIYVTFPNHLIRDVRDKESLLAHNSCTSSVIWMYELISYMLADIADITELCVLAKNASRTVVPVDLDGQEEHRVYAHDVWLLTLRNSGDKYIIDLTGPQFGYYDMPVVPWAIYKSGRMQSLAHKTGHSGSSWQPLGYNRHIMLDEISHLKGNALSKPPSAMFEYMQAANIYSSRALLSGTLKWEKTRALNVESVLRLPSSSFEDTLKGWIEFVDLEVGYSTTFASHCLRYGDIEELLRVYKRKD